MKKERLAICNDRLTISNERWSMDEMDDERLKNSSLWDEAEKTIK